MTSSIVAPRGHDARATLSRRALFLLALLALLALRVWLAFALRVNSDEPQHLHIVWG